MSVHVSSDPRAAAVGQALHDLRVAQGLTQDELAQRFGSPQSLVSKIEHSQRHLRMDEAMAYADALGVEFLELCEAAAAALASLEEEQASSAG